MVKSFALALIVAAAFSNSALAGGPKEYRFDHLSPQEAAVIVQMLGVMPTSQASKLGIVGLYDKLNAQAAKQEATAAKAAKHK